MNKLKVSFLWHMHQPCYKDPVNNVYILPWIRLHCIKEYYDMIEMSFRFPKVKQTYNMVPSLISQILDYTENNISDIFLDCSKKGAADLNSDEKKFILKNFFMCNWDNMIKPYKRYFSLLKKRGFSQTSPEQLTYAEKLFNTQDYLDIQVWFNLTWFGYAAIKEKPELSELIKKGQNFSEKDKELVINAQFDIMRNVLPKYKKAQDEGIIEISTSAFYHPILPLLYDTDFANRCMPHAKLPTRMQCPEDADAQIRKGKELHIKTFGKGPTGFWPSEGSVAPELIPTLRKYGYEWMATDEDILINSINQKDKGKILYKPYQTSFNGENIGIVFRDRGLSDLIGFTYSKNTAENSSNDLINHLHSIKGYVNSIGEDPVVFIVLDGENPWEYFVDGGEKFLTLLYDKITKSDEIEACTVGYAVKDSKHKNLIHNLYTGSWISHNFKVWIGHHEDNAGWELIKQTRKFLVDFTKKYPDYSPDLINTAWEAIYTAQGSDWFWWYGDDFSSDSDAEFDRLFRAYLEKVYIALDEPVPDKINIPIKKSGEKNVITEPSDLISPLIDGEVTSYFEWVGAGKYSLNDKGTAMHLGEKHLSEIFFGFNEDSLFIRIDPIKGNTKLFNEDFFIDVCILSKNEFKLSFNLKPSKKKKTYEFFIKEKGNGYKKIETIEDVAINKLIELAVNFEKLKTKKNDKLKFAIKLFKNDIEIERFPGKGFIPVSVPDENFKEIMWNAL